MHTLCHKFKHLDNQININLPVFLFGCFRPINNTFVYSFKNKNTKNMKEIALTFVTVLVAIATYDMIKTKVLKTA